eukprot:jgi/Phyca11/71978/gw1.29.464.1
MPTCYSRYSLQIKLRILEAARSGGDWESIAKANDVNFNTARSWLRRYSTTSDTIKNHLDASTITMKQFHKEPQYMNTDVNKHKRRDSRREYLIRLQELQA